MKLLLSCSVVCATLVGNWAFQLSDLQHVPQRVNLKGVYSKGCNITQCSYIADCLLLHLEEETVTMDKKEPSAIHVSVQYC